MRRSSGFATLSVMNRRLYGPRRLGVVLGLVATAAGLAAAELVVGAVRGASSPVLPVGQEVIDVVPPVVKDWAIAWFGTADKAVLIIGTFVVLAVIGSGVGMLAMSGRRVAATVLVSLVGVIGVSAVLARPAPAIGKVLPPIVGAAVSVAVLWWLTPRRHDAPETEPDESAPQVMSTVDRRRFVRGTGAVGVGSLAAVAVGRVGARRFDIGEERAEFDLPPVDDTLSPEGTDFGLPGVESWVVANRDFYRIDTALSVPRVSKGSWSLRVHGMVTNELQLTFADLLAREQVERYITLSCVSNEVGGGLVGNALWQGVLLRPVLEEAGIDPAATQVVSRSIDGWTCGSPTSVVMDGRDAMLAIGMNGEPLPAEHGYPVRLVVPGLYGYVSATKWVTEIELTRWEDFDGYWIPRGWSKEGPVKTMARIDRPKPRRTESPSPSGVIDIAGLAWAVHRGVSRVEVSIDGGDWLECELAGAPTDDTWRQWRYRWADATPGRHDVRARAFDGDGVAQPPEPKAPAPDGAQGYHRVEFTV